MVQSRLQSGLIAVEKRLSGVIDSDVVTLHDASLHIITSGGKRVRPQVALLSYLAAGGDDLHAVVNAAAAIELVHTATLVHDDINDHSAMRRGKLSVHARWGRTFALLTGDYMFAKVYEMMAPYGVAVNQVMSSAAVTLVEGETLQAAAAKAGEMDRETYKQVIERKTASLFVAAAEIGALVAGADDQMVADLAEFGKYLGITFQIVDDILDLIGDPNEMGKPVGLDVSQGRGVAVAQGVAHTNGSAVAVVEADDDPVQAMMNKLRASGAVEVARYEADRNAERARTALHRLPRSEARDMLEGLIDQVLARKK